MRQGRRNWWVAVVVASVLLVPAVTGGCSGSPPVEAVARVAAEPDSEALEPAAAAPVPPPVELETATAPALVTIEEEDVVEAMGVPIVPENGAPIDTGPVAAAPRVQTPLGTPEAPHVGPEPAGKIAGRLLAVDYQVDDGGTAVTLVGDGQFRFASFALEDPARFVVDLNGVREATGRYATTPGNGVVRRVRVAQYSSDPERVSRAVFDLEAARAPFIEPLPDGMRLYFPRDSTTPEVVARHEARSRPPNPPTRSLAEPEPEPTARAPEPTRGAPDSGPSAAGDAILAGPAVVPSPTAEARVARVETDPEASLPPSRNPATATIASQTTPREITRDAPGRQAARPRTPQDEAASAFASPALPGQPREYHGDPITLTLTDGDLKDTLRTFAEISGLNIVVYPGVVGSVTVELRNVPWDQALEQILRMNNLHYQLDGNIMRIAPHQHFHQEAQEEQQLRQAEALAVPMRTVIKRVSYATAADVAEVLQGTAGSVMSQRGSVTVDARTNALIIRELPQYMDTVLAVIEHLDAPEPQVHIEARIVETNKTFTRSLGVAWGAEGVADAAHGNTTGLQFPNNIRGSGGVDLLEGDRNAFLELAMGNVLNTFTLDVALQAAEREGLANILSTPSVTVLNNEQAEIQSGLSIPIQTIANNTVSVQFVNATLRLLVTPHVTAEGTVLLDINIQKREPQLGLLVPGATAPPIATKEARTRVIVRDGGTTVIGGIYEVSSSQSEGRVPGLSNIPILGHLFRSRSHTDQNDELLIFITPRVLNL